MHTSLLHPLWPPMLSFDSVCRCVSEQRTTPSVFGMHPATIHPHTHAHMLVQTFFFFFNFQPEGQHHNKHGTRHVLHLQGQAVYVLQSPLFGSCKHAIISLFMCINLIFRVFARLLSPEPQHPGGYGLRCGPSPLGCLPGPPAAV